MTNLSSTFKEMSDKSNRIGLEKLQNRLKLDWVKEEENKFSANDYMIGYRGKNIMVEFKVRNQKYSSYMLEHKKIKSLYSKRNLLKEQGLDIFDIWYVVVYFDNCYIFSFKKLNKIIKSNMIIFKDETMTLPYIIDEMNNNENYILKTWIKCDKYTATDSRNKSETKLCYFLPVSLSI